MRDDIKLTKRDRNLFESPPVSKIWSNSSPGNDVPQAENLKVAWANFKLGCFAKSNVWKLYKTTRASIVDF